MPDTDPVPDEKKSMPDVAQVESDAFFHEGVEVVIAGKTITVRPLVLGQFRKMVDSLASFVVELVADHGDVELTEVGSKHVEGLMRLGAEHLSEFLALVTDVKAEWLDSHATVADAACLVHTVLEVNKLPEIVEHFKAAARLASKQLGLKIPTGPGEESGAAPSTS